MHDKQIVRIKATQGHTGEVVLGTQEHQVTEADQEFIFHVTNNRNLAGITANGILPNAASGREAFFNFYTPNAAIAISESNAVGPQGFECVHVWPYKWI